VNRLRSARIACDSVQFAPQRAVLSQIARLLRIPYIDGDVVPGRLFALLCRSRSAGPLVSCTDSSGSGSRRCHRQAGHYIDGLQAHDFRVLDNGVPQEIIVDDFGGGLPPVSLVIAIQSSAISKLALAKIRRIAGMIQPLVTGKGGEVAVLSFDREIRWLQDFTGSDDKIRAAICNMKPGALRGARMFDAVIRVAARTESRPGRKILLLISRSQDAGSSAKLQQAIEAVERENIEIFAAHYSSYAMSWIARPEDFPDKPELDAMFFNELARIGAANHVKALAHATGGMGYSFCPAAEHRERDQPFCRRGPQSVHHQFSPARTFTRQAPHRSIGRRPYRCFRSRAPGLLGRSFWNFAIEIFRDRDQNVNRSAPCCVRALRALIICPNCVLICLPCASKIADVFTPLNCV